MKEKNIMLVGNSLSGIKIPPRNSKGNLIRFMSVMIFEVISVGTAEIKSANIDPRIAIRPIPRLIKTIDENEVILAPTRIKIKAINMVIMKEYKVDASIIPSNISFMDVGEVRIRSNDFSRVSMGRITGLIAVDVKNAVMDIMPMESWFNDISLPITQESAKKNGNINPKINTGPFLK
jgi:uncharacterized protein (UPF0262 family)